jgi:hypothetical protein
MDIELENCIKKVRYNTLEYAEQAIGKQKFLHGTDLFPYKCNLCSAYHLTSSPRGTTVIKNKQELELNELRADLKRKMEKVKELYRQNKLMRDAIESVDEQFCIGTIKQILQTALQECDK